MPVYNFESIESFAKKAAYVSQKDIYEDVSWTGETYKQSLDRARYGYEKYAEEAEKLLDKLYTEIDIPYPTYQASMYGAFPVVGDFLANSPTSMRKKTVEEFERTPINIFYDVSSSAGVNWEILLQRGIAVFALAMVLQKMRPVNLNLFATLDGTSRDQATIPVINVDLNNINLSVASYATAGVGFDRNLIHSWARMENGFTGHWAFREFPESVEYWHKIRLFLKIEPQDLLIKGAFLNDDLIAKDPLQWCKNEIEKFKKNYDEDFDYENNSTVKSTKYKY